MAKDLEVGDKAPAFRMTRDGGGEVSLGALAGKNVALYFYPKDDTPGCTTEAIDFTRLKPEFDKANTEIIGVSRDTAANHDKFAAKHKLAVVLGADEDGSVTEAYGVWKEKSLYGRKYMGIERVTFLIDATGTIRQIWPKVKVKGHADEVLAAARAL